MRPFSFVFTARLGALARCGLCEYLSDNNGPQWPDETLVLSSRSNDNINSLELVR